MSSIELYEINENREKLVNLKESRIKSPEGLNKN